MVKVSVVIPSKTAANLGPCVRSIREHEPDASILVVDDGVDWKAENWPPGLRVTFGGKPFVFARNINIGMRTSFRDGADGVILMNDDAMLESDGGFQKMAEAAELHRDVGIIGAACNNTGNPNQRPKGIGLRHEPRMVCFVCVYIPFSTYFLIGGLDERFTGYGMDDDDYCLQVRNAGLHVAIHDGCYVDHGSLTSSYRGPAGAGGDFSGNLELFKQKWGHDNWGRPVERRQSITGDEAVREISTLIAGLKR